jgi:hypothetical protein
MSSCFGNVGVSPYTEDEDATTTVLMSHARQTSSNFAVPSTFARSVLTGSARERGTDGIAA